MKHRILVYFLVLASFFTHCAAAVAGERFPVGDFKELQPAGMAEVLNVIDPQTVQLHDGRIIRLAGVEFPDFNVQDAGEFALTATEILRDMFKGQAVMIYQTKRKDWGRSNHLGHQIAHIARKSDGAWAQGTLLTLGLARAMTTQRNPEMALQMLAVEESARQAKAGLWEKPEYRVLKPEEAEEHLDSFQIVEGMVKSVALKDNRLYINFGVDWKSDFTVSIAPTDKRLFLKAGIDPMQWNNETLRVRGWIRSYNGAYMEIDHPQAVLIESGAKPAEPKNAKPESKTIEGSALPAIP